jgi:hypothetical protein
LGGLKIREINMAKGNNPLKKIFLFNFEIFIIFRIHKGV